VFDLPVLTDWHECPRRDRGGRARRLLVPPRTSRILAQCRPSVRIAALPANLNTTSHVNLASCRRRRRRRKNSQRRPGTAHLRIWTGFRLFVCVPFPSWPISFHPHAQSVPFFSSATECASPATNCGRAGRAPSPAPHDVSASENVTRMQAATRSITSDWTPHESGRVPRALQAPRKQGGNAPADHPCLSTSAGAGRVARR